MLEKLNTGLRIHVRSGGAGHITVQSSTKVRPNLHGMRTAKANIDINIHDQNGEGKIKPYRPAPMGRG